MGSKNEMSLIGGHIELGVPQIRIHMLHFAFALSNLWKYLIIPAEICRSLWVAPEGPILGTPVVPCLPFYLGVSLLKLNIWKKGTLIVKGLLGNLVYCIQDRACCAFVLPRLGLGEAKSEARTLPMVWAYLGVLSGTS